MSKFKVGDMARYNGVNAKPNSYGSKHIGCEVTILSVDNFDPVLTYEITFNGNTESNLWCRESSLEPLQKRPELGTIEELKMITGGWTPGHVTKRKVKS